MLEEENADNVNDVNGSNGQGDDNDNDCDCDRAGADIDEPGDSWRRL